MAVGGKQIGNVYRGRAACGVAAGCPVLCVCFLVLGAGDIVTELTGSAVVRVRETCSIGEALN